MTLNELETELLDLNKQIERIFELTNYQQKHNLLFVDYTEDNPDERMKFYEFESIFSHLDFVNALFSYLQQPVELTGIIEKTPHGQYKINDKMLSVGNIIEILYNDEDSDLQYWYPSIIKSTSADLTGMIARFRGNQPPHIH